MSKISKSKKLQALNGSDDAPVGESDHVLTRSQKKRLAAKPVPQLEEEILGKNRAKGSKKVKTPKPPKIQEEAKQTTSILESKSKASKMQLKNELTFMKPAFNYGKSPKDFTEEFRMIEESMMNESRANSMKYKKILLDLKSDDEYKVLGAVTLLSTELSMAQDDNLGGFQLDFLIPELVNCLNKEALPDIMLHAAASITQILDIVPQASNILVSSGGISILCQKMQNFEYVDVAENAIRALEKISVEHGSAILNAGGLEPMMNMIDFFVVSTQKSIMNIISNIFRTIPNEQTLTNQIIPVIPALIGFLSVDSAKQDTLITMFSRLTDKIVRICGDDFEKKKKHLEAIAGDKLIASLGTILSDNIDNFDNSKLLQTENILRSLNRLCYYSTKLCLDAFNIGLINIIDKIFKLLENHSRKDGQISVLAYETISLINSILALRASPLPLVGKIASYVGIKILENSRVAERLCLFKDNKQLMIGMVEKIAKRLPSVYDSNQTALYKYLLLICLEKMFSHADEEDLKRVIDPSSLSFFLSRLSESNDVMIITLTLQILEIVCPKLPHILIPLAREGLIEFINNLTEPENAQKLEAYFVSNKKLSIQSANPSFSSFLTSRANFPSGLGQAAAGNGSDAKLDKFMNYIQTLNKKFGIGMPLGLSGSKKQLNSTLDPFPPMSNYREREKLGSFLKGIDSKAAALEDKMMTEEPEDFIAKDPLLSKSFSGSTIPNFFKIDSSETKNPGGRDQVLKIDKTQNTNSNKIADSDIENRGGEKDRLTQIKSEICEYTQQVQKKICGLAQQAETDLSLTKKTLQGFTAISEALAKCQPNREEFGVAIFHDYVDLTQQNKRVTNYELRQSRLIQNLMLFTLDGTIEKKSAMAKPSERMEEEKVNGLGNGKSQDTMDIEGKGDSKLEIDEEQCKIIVGRIIVFLNAFKTNISEEDPNTNLLTSLVSNLQEMLSSNDKLSNDPAVTLNESDHNLITDFRYLTTRAKFKVQMIKNDKESPEKSGKRSRSKSNKSDSQNTDTLPMELYTYKEEILGEIPSLALSIEMFGTLELVEDYLLNKLNSFDDVHSLEDRMLQKKMMKHRLDEQYMEYIKDRMQNDNEEDELDEDNLNELNEFVEEKIDRFDPLGRGLGNNSNSNSKSIASPSKMKGYQFFDNPFQKMPSSGKSKLKGERKKLAEKLAGMDINYKKYLELKFFINGVEIPKSKTLFEIFYKYKPNFTLYQLSSEDNMTIEYKLCMKQDVQSAQDNPSSEERASIRSLCMDEKQIIYNLINKVRGLDLGVSDENLTLIVKFLLFVSELRQIEPHFRSKSSPFSRLLIELSNKHGLQKSIESYRSSFNGNGFTQEAILPQKALENTKLSALLDKIASDPLAIAANIIPPSLSAIAVNANHLLEFNSRIKYYKYGCSNIVRALYYLYHANKAKLKDLENSRVGKLQKKKIKVSRDKALDETLQNLDAYTTNKYLLEFEFFNEEGTGLGPTLEYYSVIAEELKNPVHNLWRKSDSNMLFPSPLDPRETAFLGETNEKKTLNGKAAKLTQYLTLFRCAGMLVARAILDERVIDLPFHPIFWDLVLDRPTYLEDILRIDRQLGETLIELKAIVNEKYAIEQSLDLSPEEKTARISELKFKGCSIEDLALHFTFPGHEEIELIEHGGETAVNLSNLDRYVSTLAQFYLVETNKAQILAFREGFEKILPLKFLQSLKSEEIEYLVSGGRVSEDWDKQTLEEHILPSYGFTRSSQSYINFIEVLLGFNDEQKKLFFKFVTGAERLPFGGLKHLNPKMTIVKKPPTDPSRRPDEYLPSVMTCQNYIKMPDYSSIDIMRERIFMAIKEGQSSFSLS